MASTIKVDNVQNQPGTNIINKCSTTITIGASSDTVALASGASQTGFGRTGTVDWVTTVQVTGDSPITAVTGKGYFLNTTAGTITVNLPAGAAGSIVSLADYLGTWATNNVTVAANGSEKIAGNTDDAVLKVNGQSVTLVYIDGTQGWLTTADSTENIQAIKYVTATGGTPCSGAIVCTNYKVHTFTGPGTFCVSCAGNPQGSYQVDYMVVAGGGSGGSGQGGGGGAGGYRESSGAASGCYTVSPLAACVSAISVSATPYPIAVGGGGPAVTGAPASGSIGNAGSVSSFSTIPSAGGGGGGGPTSAAVPNVSADGADGGSGGGGGWCTPGGGALSLGGTGDTPNVTPDQGFPGGTGRHLGPSHTNNGGGGGALAAGTGDPGSGPGGKGGPGGGGATSSINGTPTARAGGGGGEGCNGGAGGPGGGGPGNPSCTPRDGTINTGGGGGGGGNSTASGGGGSGVVIIRYKFQ